MNFFAYSNIYNASQSFDEIALEIHTRLDLANSTVPEFEFLLVLSPKLPESSTD